MRKFVGLDEILRDTATRKLRSAKMRRSGKLDGEEPRAVYQAACAILGQAFASEGYRYAKSGPHLTRKAGDFTYRLAFQSSHNNVRGEYVALWIHALVLSETVKRWRKRSDPASDWGYVAGGQIGNLEDTPGWAEFNLATPETRSDTIHEAVIKIRSIAMPFFALFDDRSVAFQTLDRWPVPGVEIVPAIELALSYGDRDREHALLKRFLDLYPDLRSKYLDSVARFRSSGVPDYRPSGYADELAKATVLHGLTCFSSAA